ncbi:MAG TPA: hypothetical protein VLA88_05650 [Candidatus Saccharimonadales bacterium]|nr:hypothetical protein [Candidatus Saccharimonadales bacterium]
MIPLRDSGILPSYLPPRGRYYLYDALQVDYIASKIRLARRHGSPGRDVALIELCYLQRVYESCPPDKPKSARERHAASVNSRCRTMVADGRVMTVAMLADQLSGSVDRRTVERWASDGKIVVIKIGRVQYLSVQYGNALVRLMTEYIPLPRAAEKLGCARSTLGVRVRQGRLAGLRGPDGIVRINPVSLDRLHKAWETDEPEGSLTVEAAAAALNVNIGALRMRICVGAVESVGFGSARRIPLEVIEKLKVKRTGLNPGFQWLDANIAFSDRRPTTFTARQTFRRLSISPSTLTVWSQLDLLPYYVSSIEAKQDYRIFVAQYIQGLVRFVGGGRVSKQQATEYRQRCAEAQIIV